MRGAAVRTCTIIVVLSIAMLVSTPVRSTASPRCGGEAATIVGTAGPDDIVGTDGPDVIASLGGNDSITARNGNDVVCGGRGSDDLFGDAGADWMSGGDGRDSVLGGNGNDRLSVGDGRFNALQGGPGDDVLRGGPGHGDLVELGFANAGVTVNLAAGTITGQGNDTVSRVETVFGSPFDDTLIGDDRPNTLAGRFGNDVIVSGGGGSLECSAPQPGIASFSCADILLGDPGDDALTGGVGLDVAMYFDARDPMTVNLATGIATGDGDDTLAGIEGVHGSRNGDSLTGDAGDNVFALEAGDDTVDGAGGSDLILYPEPPLVADGVVIDLGTGTATGAGSDSLTSIEAAWGSPESDTVRGDGGANELRGRAGDDTIFGDAGDDILGGDRGTDSLDGGPGTDTCTGGETVADCEGQP